ncbi:MAG: helix-turn-helix transcriptional regulator [Spirochaetes bacterium]|nr:helix-turn-helix transcriptional regulator [Spirochaetota bacterium]
MIILSSYSIINGLSKIKKNMVVVIGILLGLIYGIFNILGTSSSYNFFLHKNLIAHDNLTPSFQRPFYGREITLLVQVIVGIMLTVLSINMLLKIKKQKWKNILINKQFIINAGILFFGSSLIIGSIVKQWWIYYSSAIISTIIIGKGVLLDIKDLQMKVEKLIPFLKENFLQDLSYSSTMNSEIFTTLKLLEISISLDTFIVLNADLHAKKNNNADKNKKINSIFNFINNTLEENVGNENFFIIQLTDKKIGIAISLQNSLKNKIKNLYDLLEKIQTKTIKNIDCKISIGIGKTYENLELLSQSYIEALNAQIWAEKTDYSKIVHINDLNNSNFPKFNYPIKERDELLNAIKFSSFDQIEYLFNSFFKKLLFFTKNNISMLRIRCLEFYNLLINIALENGSRIDHLYELDIAIFSDNHIFKNINKIKILFKKIILYIASVISKTNEIHEINIIKKAKNYIEINYNNSISVDDVAKYVCISSSHFLHIFKKLTNYTYIEYLTKVRLNNAKKLLLNSDLNITEIAFNTGFNDSNYFSTVFKNYVEMSPKDFRKQNLTK